MALSPRSPRGDERSDDPAADELADFELALNTQLQLCP